MPGLGHCIIWSIAVSVYLISAWMLIKSEKGGRCLTGFLMFVSFAVIMFDALRVVLAETDPWFPFTSSVIHGTIGTILLYGMAVWFAIIDALVKKSKAKE